MAVCNVPGRTIFTGDNLDILRGVNSECVDLIYLDPPFNSNRSYAAPLDSEARGGEFDDVWTLDDMKQEWVAEIEIRRPALYHLINGARLSHGESLAGYLTFMSIRLIELHRIIKPTGSIYLHCDPNASHYLKVVMDSLFGSDNFRNEVIWKRTGAHGSARRWGPIHDIILFYSSSARRQWNRSFQEYSADYLSEHYRYQDEKGNYQLVSLTGPGTTQGESGREWRGVNPTLAGRHWAVPQQALQNAYPHRTDLNGLTTQEKLELLDAAGLIYWPPRGSMPRQKRYAHEGPGVPIQDIIIDIPPIAANAAERTEWKTQKPVALLERIIVASSDPGDLVLDPFCGGATACIAAEKLGRQWIGIDIVPQAAEVLRNRAKRELQIPLDAGNAQAWEDWSRSMRAENTAPGRTDLTMLTPINTQSEKEFLYASQQRRCAGCRYELPLHVLTVDHITPRFRGGQDATGNLQLMCHTCNAIKGDRGMAYLRQRLGELGILRE